MRPDALVAAHERMRVAKERFTKAAVAVLKGEPDALVLAHIALEQVEEARDELRRLGTEAGSG